MQEFHLQNAGTQQNMVFLTFTRLDEQNDIKTKTIVRSNAMLHFRRQERSSRNYTTVAVRSGTSTNKNGKVAQAYRSYCRTFRIRDGYFETGYRDLDIMVLDNSLHTTAISPPNGLPSTAPKYASMYLQHFIMLLNPNIKDMTPKNPVNPVRTALVPAALSQQMYFEATMYMVSTHLDVLRRAENSRTTLFHRGKSLKYITECLERQNTRPSDLLIATAFGLVNYDNVNGLLAESAAHMAGVRSMVMLRGGLQYLGMNGVLAKMILLSDTMGAALGTSQSIFQLSELWFGNPNQDTLGILPIRKTLYNQRSISFGVCSVHENIISLLSLVRWVNMQLSTIKNEQWTEQTITIFLDTRSQLHRKLYSLARDITNQDRKHPKYYQYECCRLAAQIYLESIFSPLSFFTPVVGCYVRQLVIALQKANIPADWDPVPEALVWVCLVGGAAAKQLPERGWMVAHLGPTMMSLGMLYFEDMITSMLLFVQLSRLCTR